MCTLSPWGERAGVRGDRICDVACIDLRLVIEADGGQHAAQVEKDDVRTAFLEPRGLTVMRFAHDFI